MSHNPSLLAHIEALCATIPEAEQAKFRSLLLILPSDELEMMVSRLEGYKAPLVISPAQGRMLQDFLDKSSNRIEKILEEDSSLLLDATHVKVVSEYFTGLALLLVKFGLQFDGMVMTQGGDFTDLPLDERRTCLRLKLQRLESILSSWIDHEEAQRHPAPEAVQ